MNEVGINTYLKNANRGEFQWECIEATDGYGMGGVAVESVVLKGREATITRESENEFEVDVLLKHQTKYKNEEPSYEIIDLRSNRRYARLLAERLIKQDIERDKEKENV